MRDVLEMLLAGRYDRDLSQSSAEGFHQVCGVALCAYGRSESRHGHCHNPVTGPSEPVEGHDCHQEGQCAVQTSGDTDDSGLTIYVTEPLDESCNLYLKDLPASVFQIVRRYERMRLHISVKRFLIVGFAWISEASSVV